MTNDNNPNDKTLIKVCEGQKIEGYSVIEVGIDSIGKYKDIQTPNGKIERVYYAKLNSINDFFIDKYNKIHSYRRNGETIMLYYNTETKEIIILPVMPLDDLSEPPFGLADKFIVTQEIIDNPIMTPTKGLIPITKENLETLKKFNVLNEETAMVINFNKKNPGFYL